LISCNGSTESKFDGTKISATSRLSFGSWNRVKNRHHSSTSAKTGCGTTVGKSPVRRHTGAPALRHASPLARRHTCTCSQSHQYTCTQTQIHRFTCTQTHQCMVRNTSAPARKHTSALIRTHQCTCSATAKSTIQPIIPVSANLLDCNEIWTDSGSTNTQHDEQEHEQNMCDYMRGYVRGWVCVCVCVWVMCVAEG
jgi:hypothetical protein